MPNEILEITKDFLRNPAKILVKKENLTLEGIRQYYVAIPEESQKFDVLSEIYKNLGKNELNKLQKYNKLLFIALQERKLNI
jgi:superfamily II DNA/RNA helicase